MEYSWSFIHNNNSTLYQKAKILDQDIEKLSKITLEHTNEFQVFKKELDLLPEVANCILDVRENCEKLSYSLRAFEETLYRLSVIKKENDLKNWRVNREKEEANKTKKKQDELVKLEKKLKRQYEDYQKKLEKEN